MINDSLTDIHLAFLAPQQRQDFYAHIAQVDVDAVVISSDIANGKCIIKLLHDMSAVVTQDIYFVLGNYGYYGGTVNVIKDEQNKSILIITHVSPFKEASLYKGRIADDNVLPFFCNKSIGDMLLPVAHEHQDISFLVLCGIRIHRRIIERVIILRLELVMLFIKRQRHSRLLRSLIK